MLQQLSDQDASFLYLETQETPMHIGGVSLVALPEGYQGDFYQDYRHHVAERIPLVPLLHRKLASLPFDIDHPFWVNEPNVDLDFHIRCHTLPSPGRISQLEELVGRLHSNFLDRSRPLWEFYIIKGLEDGRVAIYTKIHHAGMDGGASQHLVATMYDPGPVPRPLPPAAAPAGPARAPGVEQLLRGMAEHVMRTEIRALQYVPEALKALTRLALPDAQTLKYPEGGTLPPLQPPRSIFNTAITSQRAYAARSLSLSRCRRVARQADVKLNDVVLALCSAALRGFLREREALPATSLTAMVPVSLREAGDTSADNQNTVMLCSLATDVADPWQRLQAIKAASSDQKKLLSNIKNLLLPDLSVVGSGLLVRGMVDVYRRARLADQLPPLANLTISNVPGPVQPLYIAGARLVTMNPCSIPFHGQAINITVQGYVDALDFGLVACRRTVPDVGELADRLGVALDELEAAVAAQAAPAKATAPVPPVAAGSLAARKSMQSDKPAKPAKPLKALKAAAAAPTIQVEEIPAAVVQRQRRSSAAVAVDADKPMDAAPGRTARKAARKTVRKSSVSA